MFKTVGRVVGHHPVRVILAWVAIVLGVAVVAAGVVGNSSSASQQQTDFLPSKYESVQAAKLAARYFPQPDGAQATLVVTRSDQHRLSDADLTKASELITQLDRDADLPKLNGVDPHTLVAAPDRTVAIAWRTLTAVAAWLTAVVAELEALALEAALAPWTPTVPAVPLLMMRGAKAF